MVSFLLLAPYGLVSHWFPCMAYVYNIDLSVFSLIFTIPLACKVRSYITGVAIATSIPQWNQYLILTLLLSWWNSSIFSHLLWPSFSLRVWFSRKLLVYLFSKRTERNSKHLSSPVSFIYVFFGFFFVLCFCSMLCYNFNSVQCKYILQVMPTADFTDIMVCMCRATILHLMEMCHTVLAITEAGLEFSSPHWCDTLSHCFYFYF
jgi:hypothetical protein